MASSFLRFLDHTRRRITVGRTPSGRVISSSQRPLPDNTQHPQQKNIHAPGGNFFIVLICLHGFFRHNRARYPPISLACGHKTLSDTLRVLVKSWSRLMCLGLFSRVGAPSYSYHPVHFLSLGTTICGLPLHGPVPSSIAVTPLMWRLVL